MGGIANLLKSLGLARLVTLGVVALSMLGFFAYLGLRMTAEPMALLFSDIAREDAAKMTTALDAMNVKYELRGDGTTIFVPERSVLKLRMALAAKGLPSGGTVGYEIFDNADALGTTSFLQNINHLRALEGELSRTIRSIDGIDGARVHLVLPERELFSRNKREPTASIVLKVRGTLAVQQVKAIQQLVASAVEGLTPGHVSIVDERGALLASGAGEDAMSMVTATVEEQRTAYENRVRTHVEDIIGRVVGQDKARVEVTAQMDYNRVTQTSDIYDPNGQVVRSTQTVEDASSNSDGRQNQSVSVGNNLPNANLGGADQATTSQQKSNRNEETVNYEISRTTKTEVLEPGRIRRLSVAVLVDGTYTAGADGKTVYAPRSEQEIAKIEALVKSAIGFDQSRGDHVEVVNLRFAEVTPVDTTPLADPASGFTKADYIRIGEFAVLAILALVAMFFVFRPVLARLIPAAGHMVAPAALALPSSPAGHAAAALPGPDGALSGDDISAALIAGSNQSFDDDMMIDIAQVTGKVKHSSVRKIGELVSHHPDESISILRSWLHETA
ncbi:MAG TPA: flagellar basal-body MS-ring/collar protein FliF [Parvibaculum sp.]|uniref:flagellar basal-body MS-ring/collar protein FliF n=1 Tax=Parvibaculum sp. TaxID=2024848 RepID=UPI002CA46C4D|nr:flagellar basal-body MS-ring/collar protein FliF [Parvibaculum sp.]HMM14194.1 flagellar basal-body MS-ring/collar protein FliF [Parvibaculum sp.]